MTQITAFKKLAEQRFNILSSQHVYLKMELTQFQERKQNIQSQKTQEINTRRSRINQVLEDADLSIGGFYLQLKINSSALLIDDTIYHLEQNIRSLEQEIIQKKSEINKIKEKIKQALHKQEKWIEIHRRNQENILCLEKTRAQYLEQESLDERIIANNFIADRRNV